MAIVPDYKDDGSVVWAVYLINLKNETIESVLVTSRGYGFHKGEKVKTSTLRHFLNSIPANNYAEVEKILENVFGLNNEYWVSFYINREIYDRKYLFLPESIREENFTRIPIVEKRGVMIR